MGGDVKMLNVSTEYAEAITKNARGPFVLKLTIGSTVVDASKVKKITIEDPFQAIDNALQIGCAISRSATIEMLNAGEFSYSTDTYTVQSGITLADESIEYVDEGVFYPTAPTSDDDYKSMVIKCYDKMASLAVDYNPTVTPPTTDTAIINDICTQYGLTFDGTTLGSAINTIYVSSVRDMLGYMAGLQGKNAIINRAGHLDFKWYQRAATCAELGNPVLNTIKDKTLAELCRTDSGKISVPRTLQYQNGLKKISDSEFEIRSIMSGTKDNPITIGTGTGLSFENPYITEAQLTRIYNLLFGWKYQPCEIKWRGNPASESGDVLYAADGNDVEHAVPITSQTVTFEGGIVAEVKSAGQSGEATIQFDSLSPTEKKIKQAYTNLQQAISEASALINGAKGGIFRVTDSDSDGVNDGWILADRQDETLPNNAKCIVANYEGIGLSTDGGHTYTNAITHNGVNCSALNGGVINGQTINGGAITGTTYASTNNCFKINSDGSVTIDTSALGTSTMEIINFTGRAVISPFAFNIMGKSGSSYISKAYYGSSDFDCGINSSNGCNVSFTSSLGRLSLTNGRMTADGYDYNSLEKLKTDIAPSASAIDLINAGDIYTYKLKSEKERGTIRTHYGFIIGDNYKVPKAVLAATGKAIDGYSMSAVEWKAIKELIELNDTLTKRVTELEEKINEYN